MAIKLNFIKMWLPIQNYLKNKWRAFTFTFLTGTLIITLLGCTQPKKTETTFSLLIIVTWPTLVHRELHQHVKLAKKRSVPAITSGHNEESSSPASREESKGQENKGDEGRWASKAVKRKHSGYLSSYEVSKIIIDKGIRNRTELLALTNVQKAEGQTDLA